MSIQKTIKIEEQEERFIRQYAPMQSNFNLNLNQILRDIQWLNMLTEKELTNKFTIEEATTLISVTNGWNFTPMLMSIKEALLMKIIDTHISNQITKEEKDNLLLVITCMKEFQVYSILMKCSRFWLMQDELRKSFTLEEILSIEFNIDNDIDIDRSRMLRIIRQTILDNIVK